MKKKYVICFFVLVLGLLFLTGCGKMDVIVSGISMPENIMFSDTGRLFVTGAQNIYEVKKNPDGGFDKEALFHKNAFFMGMAQHDHYLYALCIMFSGKATLPILTKSTDINEFIEKNEQKILRRLLLRATLVDDHGDQVSAKDITFEEKYEFTDVFMPNGMVADQMGRLYIADETFLPLGKIVRITFDENDEAIKEDWLKRKTKNDGVSSPNGMAIMGNTLYFTDLNLLTGWSSVKKVSINDIENEAYPGKVYTLYKKKGGLLSIYDDLEAISMNGRSGVIVSDFFGGRMLFIEDKGRTGKLVWKMKQGYFLAPSALAIGRGPHFSENDIIVAEKGLNHFSAIYVDRN